MPAFLASLGDVKFYGPGYVSSEELNKGLGEFVDKHGPFDVAVSTEHLSRFFEYDDPIYQEFVKHYRSSFLYSFDDSDLVCFWNQTQVFMSLDMFKVAVFIAFDFQQIKKERIDYLHENFDLIGALTTQFWKPKDQLVDLHLENFHDSVNDNWYEFVSGVPDKIVPLLHFISPNEFDYTPVQLRRGDWSVLGASYASRRKARSELSRENIPFYTGKSKWYLL